MIKKLFHGRRVNFERECRVNGERGANVEHSLQHVNMYKVCFQISYKYILFSQRCIYIYIYIYISVIKDNLNKDKDKIQG